MPQDLILRSGPKVHGEHPLGTPRMASTNRGLTQHKRRQQASKAGARTRTHPRGHDPHPPAALDPSGCGRDTGEPLHPPTPPRRQRAQAAAPARPRLPRHPRRTATYPSCRRAAFSPARPFRPAPCRTRRPTLPPLSSARSPLLHGSPSPSLYSSSFFRSSPPHAQFTLPLSLQPPSCCGAAFPPPSSLRGRQPEPEPGQARRPTD